MLLLLWLRFFLLLFCTSWVLWVASLPTQSLLPPECGGFSLLIAMSVELCMSSESESNMSRLGQSELTRVSSLQTVVAPTTLDPANGLTF